MDKLGSDKDAMMARYGLVIDVDRCTGCYGCFLVCKDEHAGNDHRPLAAAQPRTGQSWIRILEEERGSFPKVKLSYIPVPCQQCADAPCLSAATGGAVYRRPDGIVIIDPDKALGQQGIVSACPYGVVFWNEGSRLPQKCTFCAHLLDQGWKEPRCVEACPTQAMVFGDLNDPSSDVSRLRAEAPGETLHPEFGLKPLVRYRSLPRRFVAGEVVFGDRPEEPAANVAVALTGGPQGLATTTDNYGDFEFAGLEPDAEYELRVEHAGYRRKQLPVPAGADANVGTIVLEAGA